MAKRGLFGVSVASVLSLGMAGFITFPVFASGPVNISIVEKVDNGSGGYKDWEDITGAMPGEVYSAIPQVQNDGTVPVSVRMCLSESATNADGGTISLPANTFGININEAWSPDNEGATDTSDPASGNCYKYNAKLEVGAMTESIFTEIALSSALGNEYQGATFNLHLEASAASDDEPDEPVTPDNPDTGAATDSEPLTTAGYVSLSIGLVVLIGMIALLLRKSVRKK